MLVSPGSFVGAGVLAGDSSAASGAGISTGAGSGTPDADGNAATIESEPVTAVHATNGVHCRATAPLTVLEPTSIVVVKVDIEPPTLPLRNPISFKRAITYEVQDQFNRRTATARWGARAVTC